VPNELRSASLCRAAIETWPADLAHVPPHLATTELCRRAAKQSPAAFAAFSPRHWRELEKEGRALSLCQTAFSVEGGEGDALCFVPQRLRTFPVCRAAVASSPWALEHVPAALCDWSLCRSAVQREPECLEFVPESLRRAQPSRALELDVLAASAAQDDQSVLVVPPQRRTAEFYAALAKNGPSESG
jgi:hypothetical protein